jgi:hypothetical protein
MHKNRQIERYYEQNETKRSTFVKKYKSVFFLCFMMCSSIGFSQADTIAHLYTFGGDNNDNAEEIEATSDGGYIVVGSTSSNSSGNTDVYLLKVDSLCNYEWSFALGGANNDWGYSVKQTFDKGYIIAASSNSYGNGGYDAVLMKRDSLGGFVWQKKYGGQDWDFAYSVVQTFDSGYVFCGETYNNTSGYSDVYVVKTNPLGDTLWTQTIGGTLIDKGNCVIETSDSNIVIAGLTNTVNDSTQAYVIKLNNNGILLWDSIYGGVGYEDFNAIIETNDGNYVSVGAITEVSTINDKDFYVYKIDTEGVEIWESVSPGVGEEIGYDVLELLNGSLFIVGPTEATGAGGKDAKIFLLTPGGFWGMQNSSFGAGLDEVAKTVVFGRDGSMKMAGSTDGYGQGLDDVLIIDVDTVVPNHQFTVDTIFDLPPVMILSYKNQSKILIYPNPASEYVLFKELNEVDELVIIDVFGRVIIEVKADVEFQLNLQSIPNGVYNVLFFNKEEVVDSRKIVVNK